MPETLMTQAVGSTFLEVRAVAVPVSNEASAYGQLLDLLADIPRLRQIARKARDAWRAGNNGAEREALTLLRRLVGEGLVPARTALPVVQLTESLATGLRSRAHILGASGPTASDITALVGLLDDCVRLAVDIEDTRSTRVARLRFGSPIDVVFDASTLVASAGAIGGLALIFKEALGLDLSLRTFRLRKQAELIDAEVELKLARLRAEVLDDLIARREQLPWQPEQATLTEDDAGNELGEGDDS